MNGEARELYTEIEFDKLYKDTITGFVGTATQICFERDGTQQVFLEANCNPDGTRPTCWVDVERVEEFVVNELHEGQA